MPLLLFVCQANILRSAAAEALATALAASTAAPGPAAADSDTWRFASSGVRALIGSPIEPEVANALAARGIDSHDHRARQLTARLLRDADLTLAFTVEQRDWAVRELPTAARSILTIRRAAFILTGAAAPASRSSAAPAHRSFPSGPPEPDHGALTLLRADRHRYDPSTDDFSDPIGTGAASIAGAVDEIEKLLRVILPVLAANHPA